MSCCNGSSSDEDGDEDDGGPVGAMRRFKSGHRQAYTGEAQAHAASWQTQGSAQGAGLGEWERLLGGGNVGAVNKYEEMVGRSRAPQPGPSVHFAPRPRPQSAHSAPQARTTTGGAHFGSVGGGACASNPYGGFGMHSSPLAGPGPSGPQDPQLAQVMMEYMMRETQRAREDALPELGGAKAFRRAAKMRSRALESPDEVITEFLGEAMETIGAEPGDAGKSTS